MEKKEDQKEQKPSKIFGLTRDFFGMVRNEKPGDATGDFFIFVPFMLIFDIVALPFILIKRYKKRKENEKKTKLTNS